MNTERVVEAATVKQTGKSRKSAKRAQQPPQQPVAGKSKLTLEMEAKGREILRRELQDTDWNLSEVARRLDMHSATNVRRAMRSLGLWQDYMAYRERNPSKHLPKN